MKCNNFNQQCGKCSANFFRHLSWQISTIPSHYWNSRVSVGNKWGFCRGQVERL